MSVFDKKQKVEIEIDQESLARLIEAAERLNASLSSATQNLVLAAEKLSKDIGESLKKMDEANKQASRIAAQNKSALTSQPITRGRERR